MAKDYSSPKYSLGIALQTTGSHPFGKGAFSGSESAHEILEKAHKKVKSYKRLASKAQAVANIEHNSKAKEVAELAREKAHEMKEYKTDRLRAR